MSIHVLMIAPTSFFSDYGGHIRILEEAFALQALGHRITIVTYYKGRDIPGLDIRRTAPLPYHANYEVGSSRHKLVFDLYLTVRALRVALRERPDLVHGHMHEGTLIGWFLSRLLRIPLVFDFQGGLTAEMIDHKFMRPGGKTFHFFRAMERFIDHRPQAILTSSKQVQSHLESDFQVPSERIVPLPDCVDLDRFNPDRFTPAQKRGMRTALGIPEDVCLVVYLGLLTEYQGIPHILQAAAQLKTKNEGRPVHFLMMGFPNLPTYRQMAFDLDVADRVLFPGKIPYDDAPLYLSLGDIAVTAKMSATEGSGKLLNYLALGLPVVAYDTPVHREYLGEFGEYVPVGDVAGLAGAIEGLAGDPARRGRLGRALAERTAACFTWPAAARQIETLYERLLAR